LNPLSRIWVFLFFFISGATGLIYEVVWTRLLTLVMGNTHYSIATVLTAFMGGLALGSYVGGKVIDRFFNPLALYALLEAAIGFYCLAIPGIIDSAFPLFKSIYLNSGSSYTEASFYRFLICGTILLIPTTFMGATLPILSKFVSGEPGLIGRDVGTLYAVNTFGAVFGAATSAYLFMRLLGLSATIQLAAGLNIGIAVIIFLVFRPGWSRPAQPGQDPHPGEGKASWSMSLQERFILLAFGVSGFCALVYQLTWNRILSLLLGSSVYAFSLILSIFILGLALGTVFFARMVTRMQDLVKVFGLLQIGIGISALVALPFFGEIPFVNRWVYQNWDIDFSAVQLSNLLIIFSLLFFPTFFMGGQFPVVVKLLTRNLSNLGSDVGRVYASNTVGTIVGSFVGGFFMIPILGIQNSILTAVFINILLSVGLLSLTKNLPTWMKFYGLPLILLACLFGGYSMSAWDKAVISSGSFMPYRIKDLKEAEAKTNRILFYKEGTHTTVTTELAVSGNIFLRVNGKTDASLALDMRTQLLSGYLPMFFQSNPESVLVIGQGSGITLGAVEQFPAVKEIDLVEISPTVIEGSQFFGPFNHQALDDDRLTTILEDGRNHVALSDKKYDVIISEPSNPWISGVGALFTVDFFHLLKDRLSEKGVACIWVHTNMSPDSFKSITRSFSTVFPHVTMWESIVGDDYLLIGSAEEYGLPYENVGNLLKQDSIGQDLKRIGIHSVRDLFSLMIMSRDQILRFSGEAPIHTDDNSLLEFNAPKYIYKDDRDVLVRQLTPYIKADPSFIKVGTTSADERSSILKMFASVDRSESQVAEIKRHARIDQLLDQAMTAFNSGDYLRALGHYAEILKLDPEHVMTYLNQGNVLKALERYDEAETAYQKTLAVNPYYVFGSVALAKLYLSTQRPAKAEEVLEKALEWYVGDSEVRVYLGLAHGFQNNSQSAIREYETALKLDSDYAPAHYYLGVQYQKIDPAKSKKHLRAYLSDSGSESANPRMIETAKKILKKL
jgi:spermidine synthase